jgi:sugar O-acyltransferase (sialic acid O-acetyltransferase NeuD family)
MPKMPVPRFILWGAKGHALVLAEIVQQQGCEVIAMFDRAPTAHTVLPGIEVWHGVEAFQAWIPQQEDIHEISAAAAIGGSGRDRRDLLEMFRNSGLKTPTLIHHSAVISKSARHGEGSHILAGAILAPMAKIGEACIVNTNATVDHECILAAGVHVAPGATLCGCVQVGENTFVGAGSVVLPRIKIGADVVIGSGSVVTRDIPDGVVAFGNPAKEIPAY